MFTCTPLNVAVKLSRHVPKADTYKRSYTIVMIEEIVLLQLATSLLALASAVLVNTKTPLILSNLWVIKLN